MGPRRAGAMAAGRVGCRRARTLARIIGNKDLRLITWAPMLDRRRIRLPEVHAFDGFRHGIANFCRSAAKEA
jgi:hypothetical protein